MELNSLELLKWQEGMTDSQRMFFTTQYFCERKDRSIALILSVLFGFAGIDRFYVGDMGLGLLKLFTGGLCGILYLVDIFLIPGVTDEKNRAKAQTIAAAIRSRP